MIRLLRGERSRLWHLCGATRPFTATVTVPVIGHDEAKEAPAAPAAEEEFRGNSPIALLGDDGG